MSSRQTLESLERSVPSAVMWVVSTFPRGSTQVVLPAKVPQSLLKAYSKGGYLQDRATWSAILENKPLVESECLGTPVEGSPYYREVMLPGEVCHIAVAPLAAPIFPGYAGAIHLYRNAEQGPFSAADVQNLARHAKQFDQAVDAVRMPRLGKIPPALAWMRRPAARQFIFDGNLKPIFNEAGLAAIDDRVRDQMMRNARQVLSRVGEQPFSSDRLCLSDSRGDLWVYRVVTYNAYPALGTGPFVFYCMQPDCKEWGAVRATDLQADPELARLAPAMQFMHREFGRGPTLNDIAETVGLSPFHFHRRFTELFGITPKHFLLECQITAAKTHIATGDKDLVEIANSCGFAHQSHFTSRFKQATGLTPTGWRKMADEMRMPTR